MSTHGQQPTTGRPVVELSNLTFAYPSRGLVARTLDPVLHEVSIAVNEREVVGLVGESGSGKSTIGRIMLGLEPVPAGKYLIDGTPFTRRRGPRQLAAVLQNPAASFDPTHSVGSSVGEPLRIQERLDRVEVGRRVAGMLELVGLDPAIAARRPSELSGGQRQRASIARALITNPRFVLFDEAVSALDVSVQAQILSLIRELKTTQAMGALFISHDIAATRYVADRMVVLRGGRVVDEGPAADFYKPREQPYARALQVASGLATAHD
ncbi:ABC transporter ATP-binding protein [Paeniglutamicibacter sp. R2-26]|uniref:ABC transporter ATP-binding protein n=1 Tax=Paeniglutamicibacter sp. R2-26 TaxID=3144417 RepID=UPI003EE6B997